MVKSMLLGLALVVVGFTASANAAAMSFRGAVTGGAYNGLTYNLSFNVTDVGATGSGNTTNSVITGGSLVFSNAATLTVTGGSVAFADNVASFPSNIDGLNFGVNFSGGDVLNFTYLKPNGPISNGINLNNMYSFMYSFGGGVPFAGPGYASIVDVTGFGGGSGGSVQAIPEPASMSVLALLTCGAGGLAYRRRKIAKK